MCPIIFNVQRVSDILLERALKKIEVDLQRVIQVSQATEEKIEELRSSKDFMEEEKIRRLKEQFFMLR